MIKLNKIFKLTVLVLLSAFAAASCTRGLEYTPGELEADGNYGVYFPEQVINSKLQLSPDDKREVSYKVKRTNTKDAISVPVVLTENEKDVFIVSEIYFADGQAETELRVAFPKAKTDGTEYSISINIEDPQYISIYSKKKTGVSLSVSIAKWATVEPQDGQSRAKWRDDILSSMYSGLPNPNAEIELDIQEREDKKGLYRLKAYGSEMMAAIFNVPYTTEEKYIIVDATDPKKVWIPRQEIGVTLNPADGAIRIASFVDKQFSIDESQSMYGELDENGVITFPVGGIYCNLTKALGEDEWIPVNASGMLRLMLPGARLFDYSAKLKNLGYLTPNVMTFDVKLGADATKFVYKVYEGEIDGGAASLYAQELAGVNGGEKPQPDGESTGQAIQVTGLATGKYTLIGYTCDASGQMKGYASATFGFVGKGDNKSVKLVIGLEGTNEFAGQGYNEDNSVRLYAYGEEITEIRYWLYRTDKVSEQDKEKYFNKNAKKFTEQELKMVNSKHFSTMLTGLNGQCNYKLMVKASNGYTEATFEAEYSTEGIFNPILEDYTFGDFKKLMTYEYLLNKEWNFYATNRFDKNPRRKLMPTKVRFEKVSGSELKVFGLTGMNFDLSPDGKTSSETGIQVSFSIKEGYCGLNIGQDPVGMCEGRPVSVAAMPNEEIGATYSGNGMMLIGKVADGFLYFAPNPIYAGVQGLTFANLLIMKGNTNMYWLTDIVLADPEKDITNPGKFSYRF